MHHAPLHLDTLPPRHQALVAALARFLPYSRGRALLRRLASDPDPRMRYVQYLKLELLWFRDHFLRRHFLLEGTELLDPAETYIFTSLHFGNFCMYGAALNRQTGIRSQTVATGRNLTPGTPDTHFWVRYAHRPQILSGFPVCYSTDTPYQHIERLARGISLNMLVDPREQDFKPREYEVCFLGRPLSLQRAVPLLARRAGVRIAPYIGYYDDALGCHRVRWFSPFAPERGDQETLQRITTCFEAVVGTHRTQSFNVL
jgi:lauroyl/myristoyl acyltransferase